MTEQFFPPTKFAAELELLHQELKSYSSLGENWDGEGSSAPSHQAVCDALKFLEKRPDDIPPPHSEVGAEGDVGVYWDILHTQVFVEVVFEGDGTYYYFAIHGKSGAEGEEHGDESVDVADRWPSEILDILRKEDQP